MDIGVGTNPDNINDWIEEIWWQYCNGDKETGLLEKKELYRWVKNSFRLSTFEYKFTEKEFGLLYKRFDQNDDG